MRTTLRTISLAALAVFFSGALSAQMRVATADAMKAAVRRPSPEYSAMAKQLRVTGDVEVDVTIAPSGDVEDVKVISGNAMLSAGVTKALKDWKFTPFVNDGKPTQAIAALRFSFKP